MAEYVTIEDVDEGYRDCGKRKGNTEGYMEKCSVRSSETE